MARACFHGLLVAALAWTSNPRPAAPQVVQQAVPWPRCSDRLDGQQLCGNGSVCECHYDAGGTLTGRVAAWRWSCDILKMCGDPVPAGADPQPLPPGFSYAPSGQQNSDPNYPEPPSPYGPKFPQRGGWSR